jgi:hypothetical protein
MKCVWITGTVFFLALLTSLALLPCLLPAPIAGNPSNGVANAATVPVQVSNLQFASDKSTTLPSTMVFTANKPQVVGRLYLNEQGKLAFEGDVDASAQAFIEAVNRQAAQK